MKKQNLKILPFAKLTKLKQQNNNNGSTLLQMLLL